MNEINGITYLYLTYGVMYGVVVHTHISPGCSLIKKINFDAAMTNALKTCLKTALVSVAFKFRRVHGTFKSDAWLTVGKNEMI